MIANPTVLHVEDDLNDRVLLQSAFRRAQLSLRLESAANGEAAIAYLSGTDLFEDRTRFPFPDLVLLDLKMPRKSGFEVLDWIREFGLICLPVVVFSSSKNEADIKLAYEKKANSYLVKPVLFEDLVAVARDIHRYWFVLNHTPARA